MMLMRSHIGALILVFLMPLLAADAHEQSAFDQDDSSGPLDLAAIRHRHRRLNEATPHSQGSRRVTELRFGAITYEQWSRSILSGGKNFISIEFNFDKDKRIERCLVINNGKRELIGRLYRGCYANDELITTTSVSRRDKHSVHTAFDKHRLARGLKRYRWRLVTSFEDPAAGVDGACAPASSPTPMPYGTCSDFTTWKLHEY